ncbi:MAG: septum formation protein Maf [Dehalococcoidia bacterium]|nr:septum formation protein Maf [Dehalococcoidia bacterium]
MRAQPALVLASSSPRRRELLAALGIPFTVTTPPVDEAALVREMAGATPEALASALARAKAEHAPAPADAVVLAGDTVVALDGQVFGKPADVREARAMLRALRGRQHLVVSAIAVRAGGQIALDHAAIRVWMRPYTDEEIERFIASGAPFDKAGAYAIQDGAFAPVERYEGCYCGVVGLPLRRAAALLAAAGLTPWPPGPPADADAACAACPDPAG